MKEQWMKLQSQFDALNQREKWLIFVSGSIGFLFLLFSFLLEPEMNRLHEKERQLATEKNNIQRIEGDTYVMQSKIAQSPEEETNRIYQQLLAENQTLTKELSDAAADLISPNQMAELLEKVLKGAGSESSLKLVSLTSLPAESITDIAEQSVNSFFGYFIHPVRIELTGNYADITQYLSQVEQLSMKYHWRSFDYMTEEYPRARLILIVYTLGPRQEFIGG